MTGPKLVLPSLAMPWGRWVEDTESSTSSALRRLSQEVSNGSSSLVAQTDSLAANLSQIPSLAGIYQRVVPPFSVSRGFSATFRVWDSPLQVFNPPRPDTAYTASVIANIRVSGVNLTFGRSFLRINGKTDAFLHENMQGSSSSVLSIMGTVDLAPGEPLSTQFAVSSAASGTANFSGCTLTAIFNGRIS